MILCSLSATLWEPHLLSMTRAVLILKSHTKISLHQSLERAEDTGQETADWIKELLRVTYARQTWCCLLQKERTKTELQARARPFQRVPVWDCASALAYSKGQQVLKLPPRNSCISSLLRSSENKTTLKPTPISQKFFDSTSVTNTN